MIALDFCFDFDFDLFFLIRFNWCRKHTSFYTNTYTIKKRYKSDGNLTENLHSNFCNRFACTTRYMCTHTFARTQCTYKYYCIFPLFVLILCFFSLAICLLNVVFRQYQRLSMPFFQREIRTKWKIYL